MNIISVLSLLLVVASLATAQPTWTDIMNYTGYTNEASGKFWIAHNGYPAPTTQTNISSSNGGVMDLLAGGSITTTGGNDTTCTSPPGYWTAYVDPVNGVYRNPQMRIVSYYGPNGGSYKGLGFKGTLNQNGNEGGSGVLEAVYFHEQVCYFGGREYGFHYDPYTDLLKVYWEVNANCGASSCSGLTDRIEETSLGTGWSGTEYYFEMYPESYTNPNSPYNSTCRFNVKIKDTSFNVVHSSYSDMISTTMLGIDSNFCTNIFNAYGYVTAGIVYWQPTVTGLDGGTNLTLSRVYVGK